MDPQTASERPTHPARARSVWLALAVVFAYVLLAAGLGSILSGLVSDDEDVAQFALGHFIPLAIGIGLMLLFLRWQGWGADVWREPPTPTLKPRRWWLVSIPVLAVLIPASQLGNVPWAAQPIGFFLIIAAGTLMVGIGEELAIRGILLTAVRSRHGELVTMLITSAVFAACHIPSYLIAGAPPLAIAFAVGTLAAAGATYYWIRRVTGRLWVGMIIHAFTDWGLYVAAGADVPAASVPSTHGADPDTFLAIAQSLLMLATAIGIISLIREDRRTRAQRRAIDA